MEDTKVKWGQRNGRIGKNGENFIKHSLTITSRSVSIRLIKAQNIIWITSMEMGDWLGAVGESDLEDTKS